MYCSNYRIAQNFDKVNFWQLVGRHAIGGTNPAQLVFTNPHTSITFKILAGKILAGLDKSAKIFHHQNFMLYGIRMYIYLCSYNF